MTIDVALARKIFLDRRSAREIVEELAGRGVSTTTAAVCGIWQRNSHRAATKGLKRLERHRRVCGERNGQAKLTWAAVRDLRLFRDQCATYGEPLLVEEGREYLLKHHDVELSFSATWKAMTDRSWYPELVR